MEQRFLIRYATFTTKITFPHKTFPYKTFPHKTFPHKTFPYETFPHKTFPHKTCHICHQKADIKEDSDQCTSEGPRSAKLPSPPAHQKVFKVKGLLLGLHKKAAWSVNFFHDLNQYQYITFSFAAR